MNWIRLLSHTIDPETKDENFLRSTKLRNRMFVGTVDRDGTILNILHDCPLSVKLTFEV